MEPYKNKSKPQLINEMESLQKRVKELEESEAEFNRAKKTLKKQEEQLRAVLDNAVPVYDENGNLIHYQGYNVDITEQKRAEERLYQSEEKYRNLTENMYDIVYSIDINGVLTYISSQTNRYGIVPEKLISKNLLDIIYPEDREKLGMEFRRALEKGEEFPSTFRILDAKGDIHWFEDIGKIQRDENGNITGLAGVLRDVTKRKQAEEESRHSKELLRTVLDIIPAFICAKNLDGRFILVNKKLTDFYDTTVDEMTGILHADICEDKKELQAMLAADREVIKSDKPKLIPEEKMENPDGSITVLETYKIPFATHNEPAVLIAAINITERNQAEEALRKSEERFRQVAESAEEWIWEVDDTALYTYASPVVEKLLGYKPEELVGKKHSYDLFHPDDIEPLKKATLELFAEKKPLFRLLNRNVHKNGQIIWLSTSGVPIIDDKGNLIGYRGADIDITEQKKAEEELEKHREHLKELIKERTKELEEKNKKLEEFNKLFVGREFRIKELKDKIKGMKAKLK